MPPNKDTYCQITTVLLCLQNKLFYVKVGGNRRAREFFDSQDDWDATLPLQQRYNSRAAALYRDKVKLLNLFKRINVSHIRQNRESIVILQKINFEFFL